MVVDGDGDGDVVGLGRALAALVLTLALALAAPLPARRTTSRWPAAVTSIATDTASPAAVT